MNLNFFFLNRVDGLKVASLKRVLFVLGSRHVETSNSIPSEHLLLSFSFPSDVVASVKAADMIREMNEKYNLRLKGQYMWKDICVEMENLCLPYVAL